MDGLINFIPLLSYLVCILLIFGGRTTMEWEQIVSIIIAVIALIGTLIGSTRSSNLKIFSSKSDLSKEHGNLSKEHIAIIKDNEQLKNNISETKSVMNNICQIEQERIYHRNERERLLNENQFALIEAVDKVSVLKEQYISAINENISLRKKVSSLTKENSQLKQQIEEQYSEYDNNNDEDEFEM